jgi:hypothetical protein
MLTLLRRFLVVAALMFWQGGFTFYAAVVVPVGQSVLGSHLEQGLITRQVTRYLNLAGAIALLILAWDAAASRSAHRRYRWGCWLGMTLSLAGLVWMHTVLNGLIDADAPRILDQSAFRAEHRLYLWVSTAQWAFGVVYAILALRDWAWEDRQSA